MSAGAAEYTDCISAEGQDSPKWPSQLGLQNTLTASQQRGKTLPMSVLDMILNNLMLRLQ